MTTTNALDNILKITAKALNATTHDPLRQFYQWQINTANVLREGFGDETALRFFALGTNGVARSGNPADALDQQLLLLKHLADQGRGDPLGCAPPGPPRHPPNTPETHHKPRRGA